MLFSTKTEYNYSQVIPAQPLILDKSHPLRLFANFLLSNKLSEIEATYQQLLQQEKAAIQRSHVLEFGRLKEFLTYVADDTFTEFIKSSSLRSIVSIRKPEPILRATFLRRKIVRMFIPEFTSDVEVAMDILEELDRCTVLLDAAYLQAGQQFRQTLFQKITDLTPCIVSAYNVNTGKYLFINRYVESILGFTREEVYSKGIELFFTLIHPDDLPEILANNHQALDDANQADPIGKEIREFTYRMRHKNGGYRWFVTYGTVFSRNAEHKVEEVINISLDITEQMKNAHELKAKIEEVRRNEDRFHRMTEDVEDYAILLLDKEGNIENWNKGAMKIKGYSAEEIIGKNFRIFYSQKEQEEKLPESLIELANKNGKAAHEGWRVRKDGQKLWGSTVITALKDERGEIIGYSKVTRDLTSKKEDEELLKRYAENLSLKNAKLEQINKELESFSYIASHDLQEPLRKIKTFINFIRAKEENHLSPTSLDYFSRISGAADRMNLLIESLLNFSTIGLAEEHFDSVELNHVLEEAKKDLSHVIQEKKATIQSTILPRVNGIGMQLHQLFVNIISNSIKYSQKHLAPVINISAELVEEKKNAEDPAKTYWKIGFSDNSIGFEPHYAEKIFELFERLHGKKEYSGTGIGLAICKKIATNHNGFMKASGMPGKGAHFDLYLPIDRN